MRAVIKDFFRGMLKNKGKFISVFFIILIGAAFFSGIRSSRGDMLASAERYYDEYSLADITVISTLGLTEDDVRDLSALPQVEMAEGVYTLDALCDDGAGLAAKLISLSSDINVPSGLVGRLPQSADECVLDNLFLELGDYSVGDSISFVSEGEKLPLAHSVYTIVGFADLPQYMDLNRGTGSVGSGSIDGFVLLMPQAFTQTYYTQINVKVSGAAALDSYGDDYDPLISSAKEGIEGVSGEAGERRREQLAREYASLFPFLTPEQLLPLVPQCQWYVLGREVVSSYVGYRNDADRIDSLGELLPIVFYLVAALVSLTAMTRLVEEERQQIGVLKAVGFSNGAVFARYLMYALIPTLLGSVAGVLIGEKLFPFAIMNTYAMLYSGLKSFVLPYNFIEGGIAVIAGVVSTGVATFAAGYRISRETPALIMRPEAPKPGKRVFLERVPFVWNRLGFTQKSTVRNLFRNKKRFLMTIIGVAGCMGLVLVGLGLHDSIMVVVDKQFSELTHYQASVTLSAASAEDRQALLDEISELGGVSSYVMYQRSVDATGSGGVQAVTLSVPQNLSGIENYFTFRTRAGRQPVSVAEGAIVSEKTASVLGAGVGDDITLTVEGLPVSVKVTGIFENYIGHYVFMSEESYSFLFGSPPAYNVVLLGYAQSAGFEEELGQMLVANDAVQGVSFMSDLIAWADDTLSSLNTIVFIVLAAAALLAFVVLYNLNSINIAERKRELATLKVLGFYEGEVATYVYRENMLLTIIGIVLGIGLGILLHSYVITAIEVDLIMFGRSIYWYSYLIGAALTFGFSLIVNFVMFPGIKKIDMVESLKSVE